MAACPICGKPSEARLAPFCSKRCADIDLGRWLKGSYVVPGTDEGGKRDVPAAQNEDGGEDGDGEEGSGP